MIFESSRSILTSRKQDLELPLGIYGKTQLAQFQSPPFAATALSNLVLVYSGFDMGSGKLWISVNGKWNMYTSKRWLSRRKSIWYKHQELVPMLLNEWVWYEYGWHTEYIIICSLHFQSVHGWERLYNDSLIEMFIVSADHWDPLINFITWLAVHCFSSVHCTQCVVQYSAL